MTKIGKSIEPVVYGTVIGIKAACWKRRKLLSRDGIRSPKIELCYLYAVVSCMLTAYRNAVKYLIFE